MFGLIFLICYFGLALSAPAPAEDLPVLGIVGGERANQNLFNYQVSLELGRKHFCGGALITTNLVITAAHCVQNIRPEYLRVRVGSSGREVGGAVYEVTQIAEHSKFTMETLHSDIAILKLSEHVRPSKTVGTIPLATEEPIGDTNARVSGWGHTKEDGQLSDHLLFATITIFDRFYCARHLSKFTPDMICAGRKEGGVDSCQADSGGPLVANNRLIGIVSWGNGCGRPGSPGVYTNVAYMRPWIHQAIRALIKSN